MNEFEICRTVLQYAFDHRHEHNLQLIEVEKIPNIKNYNSRRVDIALKILFDENLLENFDRSALLCKITTQGIRLVNDKALFNDRFPIEENVLDITKDNIETLESLLGTKYHAPYQQFLKAKSFLFDNQSTDYLNAIKESVGALEAVAKIIYNEPNKTLGDLLKQHKDTFVSHPSLIKIYESVYAVRGNEPGIAHGLHVESSLGFADAEYILNVCAASIIYLVRRTDEENKIVG